MTPCSNAKRKDGYPLLTRKWHSDMSYVPANSEYHLEPEWVADVTSLHYCECPRCRNSVEAGREMIPKEKMPL